MLRRASLAGIAGNLVVAVFCSQGTPELAHAFTQRGLCRIIKLLNFKA